MSGRESVATSRLCTSDIDNIWIRGRNLVSDLMGHVTFTEMMLFHPLGQAATPMQVKIVDAVLVTIMEHGLTPSSIAARETYLGAPEALQGAVAAGLLSVGSRFAGTAGDCAKLFDEIVRAPVAQRAAVVESIVKRHREAKIPLPGFGHPHHKNGDPRTPRLVEIAHEAGAKGDYVTAMYDLARAANAAYGKNLVINVSSAIGAVLLEAGLPMSVAQGITLISRCAGLVGHLLEEMEKPIADFIWHLVEDEVLYSGPAPGKP
jgi:citrate synthase